MATIYSSRPTRVFDTSKILPAGNWLYWSSCLPLGRGFASRVDEIRKTVDGMRSGDCSEVTI